MILGGFAAEKRGPAHAIQTPLPLRPVARRLLRMLTHHGHQAVGTLAPGVYLIVV
jgi:hypothetical protein